MAFEDGERGAGHPRSPSVRSRSTTRRSSKVADATTKLANPVFYVKMGFIALAVINIFMLRKRVFRDPLLDKRPVPMNGKVLALTSLTLWIGSITAGRLMAYLGPVSGLK